MKCYIVSNFEIAYSHAVLFMQTIMCLIHFNCFKGFAIVLRSILFRTETPQWVIKTVCENTLYYIHGV